MHRIRFWSRLRNWVMHSKSELVLIASIVELSECIAALLNDGKWQIAEDLFEQNLVRMDKWRGDYYTGSGD